MSVLLWAASIGDEQLGHCSTRDCSAVASHSEWDHHTK